MDAIRMKREFLEYIEITKGRSIKTVENYDRYLTRFLQFAKTDSPSGITDALIREFRLWLNRQPAGSGTLKRKTQNFYLIALRAFLKYLAKRDIKTLQPEKIELAKTSQRELDLISEKELFSLLSAPDEKTLSGLRDKAMLEELWASGKAPWKIWQ